MDRRSLRSMTDTYPVATSEAATAVMRGNRKRDTRPELRLRRALHALGLRYRVDRPIAVGGGRPIRPDVVFGPVKVAVFIHGCFWHACPEHCVLPRANREWWEWKFAANRARDADTDEKLRRLGWLVLRIWEHEKSVDAADRVALLLSEVSAPERP